MVYDNTKSVRNIMEYGNSRTSRKSNVLGSWKEMGRVIHGVRKGLEEVRKVME